MVVHPLKSSDVLAGLQSGIYVSESKYIPAIATRNAFCVADQTFRLQTDPPHPLAPGQPDRRGQGATSHLQPHGIPLPR